MIYHIIDIFFLIFHTSLVIFSITGWIWEKTRKINLAVNLLIGSSWLFLGMITGVPGYCPFTDWHFSALERLGKTDLPSSYVKYLADRITGMNFNQSAVDHVTLYVFLAALAASLFVNIRHIVIKRRKGGI